MLLIFIKILLHIPLLVYTYLDFDLEIWDYFNIFGNNILIAMLVH